MSDPANAEGSHAEPMASASQRDGESALADPTGSTSSLLAGSCLALGQWKDFISKSTAGRVNAPNSHGKRRQSQMLSGQNMTMEGIIGRLAIGKRGLVKIGGKSQNLRE